MATVYKRTWKTKTGERRSAWMLSYVDRDGQRLRKQFTLKRDADNERVRVEGQLAAGTHVPDKGSMTVLDAAKAFLADFEELVRAGKRDRETQRMYGQFVNLHLAPFDIANERLSRLTGPMCKQYAKELEQKRSEKLGTRVFKAFRMIVRFARSEGWISANPTEGVSVRTTSEGIREEEALEIPSKASLRALVKTAETFDDTGMAAALVSLLLFGGLRSSELRGSRVVDVKFLASSFQVCQTADRWQRLGSVKTKNARRTIPLPRHTIRALRCWTKKAPLSSEGLLFPNGVGKVESYANLYHRVWVPLMGKAKLVTEDKVPIFGMHALRHAAVSLWIESGATPKKVMTWAGHASIQFTMDTYGHLWADATGDAAIAAAIERSVLAKS